MKTEQSLNDGWSVVTGHLGEDNTSLSQVLVENPDLRLISGVLDQSGQYSKDQHLQEDC